VSDDAIAIRPLTAPPDAVVRVPARSRSATASRCWQRRRRRSVLDGVLFSDDTRYMAARCALGIAVEADEAAARLTVDGGGGTWPRDAAEPPSATGTAMRFLSPRSASATAAIASTAARACASGRSRISSTLGGSGPTSAASAAPARRRWW
jgi:hypothetical protein